MTDKNIAVLSVTTTKKDINTTNTLSIKHLKNFIEELARVASALALLIEDRLAKVDAFATDVNVAGAFDERTHITVALAAKRTVGVLFAGGGTASGGVEIFTRGHALSFAARSPGDSVDRR